MKIQELMSKPAVVSRRDETLNMAAQKMWDHDCGALPVVGDDGQLAGIITDRDICMSAWSHGAPLDSIHVEDAMAKEVFSVKADEDLHRAEKLMAEKQVRRLPVVDADNRPIGLVSMSDLAREAARPGTRLKDELTRILQTVAAIFQPRKGGKAAA